MTAQEYIKKLESSFFDKRLKSLYSKGELEKQKKRLKAAAEEFVKEFPKDADTEISIFSAPGRTEIGGNHTDHQHGCVLAAAVNLDIIGVVHFNNEPVVRIKSEGYLPEMIDLTDLSVREEERETSSALVRGTAEGFKMAKLNIGGFDAYITSDVPGGSGLSSSAAFEILIGTIMNCGCNNGIADAVTLAHIGQYAENVYFGKKSGLMDQAASSVGGLVFMDFLDPENPKIKSHNFDFEEYGYTVCITDTKGSHSDLSDEYSHVAKEMTAVARELGCDYLREADEKEFYRQIPRLRGVCSDRAVLRAMHFFDDNRRAQQESEALSRRNTEEFLKLVRESGESSANLLQNLFSVKRPDEQNIPLALALSRHILGKDSAVRVHGGGFAGTIQAIIPTELTETYVNEMERLFGKDSCRKLRIRSEGGAKLL
ncbi:MAG: galactokinase [Clostridiales bacterium]|nr:galactokinase [Clostridiales bacterium]